jgi:hypothetical protein
LNASCWIGFPPERRSRRHPPGAQHRRQGHGIDTGEECEPSRHRSHRSPVSPAGVPSIHPRTALLLPVSLVQTPSRFHRPDGSIARNWPIEFGRACSRVPCTSPLLMVRVRPSPSPTRRGRGARSGTWTRQDRTALGVRSRWLPMGGSDPPVWPTSMPRTAKAGGCRVLAERADMHLAFCLSHVPAASTKSLPAGPADCQGSAQALAGPYAIESDTLGRAADEPLAVRQDRSWATIDDLEPVAGCRARPDQPGDQACRGDPLCPVPLGRINPLPRRRPCRDRT